MLFPKSALLALLDFSEGEPIGPEEGTGLPRDIVPIDDSLQEKYKNGDELRRMVFRYDGQYYRASYRIGEDCKPFEFDDDLECEEVYPHVVQKTVYKNYKQE